MDIVDKGVVLKKKKVNKKNENNYKSTEAKLNKNEKSSNNKLFKKIIKIVIIFSIVLLSIFNIMSTRKWNDVKIYQQFDQMVNKAEPFAIVLYDTYSPLSKSKADNIDEIYAALKRKLSVLMIEYKENDKKSHFFIDKYEVETLPAIILLKANGEKVVRFSWPFSASEIAVKAGEVLIKKGK